MQFHLCVTSLRKISRFSDRTLGADMPYAFLRAFSSSQLGGILVSLKGKNGGFQLTADRRYFLGTT